jgi:hypothetical protein
MDGAQSNVLKDSGHKRECAMKKFDRIYQFKITLKGIKPNIWRRIQVPETYSFWDLHVAVQDAMPVKRDNALLFPDELKLRGGFETD